MNDQPKQHRLLVLIGFGVLNTIAGYIIFRIFTVAFAYDQPTSFIERTVVVIFFIGEFFILAHAANYFTDIMIALWRYRRWPIVYGKGRQAQPFVRIGIPVRDEPILILRRTLMACRLLDYPNVEITVVDNSSTKKITAAIRALCKEQGVTHFLVPFPRHGAKAGALNEFIKKTRARFIAVFDADFSPSRDFLKLTVPLLIEDQKIAFVQTPQFYSNLVSSVVSRASQVQQSIFYEHICEAKSIRNAMFMCGTNIVIRTKALRSIRGFREGSVTEDFDTSFALMSKGWHSRFYNYTTAFGYGPPSVLDYMRQQYRWARGTLGVFLEQAPSLWSPKNRLSFGQRIEYTMSGSYYFIGFAWLILIIMPLLYIFSSIPAYFTPAFLYVVVYLPYLLFSMGFFFYGFVSRRYFFRDWLIAQSLTMLAIPVYMRASIDAVLGRRAVFQVTGKEKSENKIPWRALKAQIIMLAAHAAAIGYGLYRIINQPFDNSLVISFFWALVHFIILSSFFIAAYVETRRRA
ncbi:MAG: glycosyltransferase family 2 protein [bacterium]|nr:glycosyltransferase family 2 protein [bacterium]